MLNTSTLHIDLGAVDHNAAVVREALASHADPPAKLCAVIKADAYGLGAVRVAHRLEKSGVDMFGVYTLAEAMELLAASVRTPVLIMSPVRSIADSDTLYRAVSHGRLHFSAQSLEQTEALGKQADRFGVEIPLHVDVNTGMNRGQAAPAEALDILRFAAAHRRLIVAGVSTHFSSADRDADVTRRQMERFQDWLTEAGNLIPPKALLHAANTFGVFRTTASHLGMARVGIALAGFAIEEMGDPDAFELLDLAERLEPTVRWVSAVAHLQWIDAGERVGYRGEWTAARRTRVALAPVGYADGYPLSLSGTGVVRVGGGDTPHEAPVIGRVSMDQITIDVTDLPVSAVGIGSEVELIGLDKHAATHLPRVAHLAGTGPHELLCRLGRRAPRRYLSQREPAVVTRPVASINAADA